MFEYVEKLQARIATMVSQNEAGIRQAAHWFSEAIVHNKMIHMLGTGHSHMVGLEGFIRAGVTVHREDVDNNSSGSG